MICNRKLRGWAVTPLLVAAMSLLGCNQHETGESQAAKAQQEPASLAKQAPITIQHQLGETVIDSLPHRVVALDMNEVDFLDQLDVPIAGMPKDFIPDFLLKYKGDPAVEDTGAIVQPNLERVYAAKPDLILMTSLQAKNYKELTEIAPTIHFDVNYRDSEVNHIEVIKNHLLSLGKIFNKMALAEQKVAGLDEKVAEVQRITQGRPEKALILLHNNGSFRSFGVKSRYGFVFSSFGVKPASPIVEAGLHGQPISSEFIQQANPDIIYIVDRTAVMEGRPVMDAETLSNPLIRQTVAWQKGRVIFVDAPAWYVMAASPTSLSLIVDDVIKGYQP